MSDGWCRGEPKSIEHERNGQNLPAQGPGCCESLGTIARNDKSHIRTATAEQERIGLTSQLEQLTIAISALSGSAGGRGGGRRGTMSAAGRARIAAAQRARWAKLKSQKVVSIASRKRRKLPFAGIARIRAAQKARWTKWSKQHKTASAVICARRGSQRCYRAPSPNRSSNSDRSTPERDDNGTRLNHRKTNSSLLGCRLLLDGFGHSHDVSRNLHLLHNAGPFLLR
jgi:hypothetical protein